METVAQTFALSISIDDTRVKAVINMADASYEFRPSSGFPLDPYHDPAGEFIQECIVCLNTALPGFRAIYRPDRASSREEWVFEWGDPWLPPPSASMGAYTAQITQHNGSVISIAAPAHYWFSRWRWQSAPRRVRRSAEQLWSQNLIPVFDTAGLATGGINTVAAYTPMAYCGIPADQGTTGGYPGLGIQTGWQTQFLCRGAPESSFRNQGEAGSTFQSHCRDTHTWAPIDIVHNWPHASKYSSKEGDPYIPPGPRANRTDQGHMPSVYYVPWLLTGDPYYLEGCMFWANENMLALPGWGSRFMVAGRYLAWPLRAIAELVASCPETVPTWMLPRSYWIYWLDKCRGFVEDRMHNSSDPFYYVFHTIQEAGQDSNLDPVPSGDHVWQQNMLDLVAAWVASFRDEWTEPAEWLIHSSIDRASATSGWCRSRPSPYHLRMQCASVLAAELSATATTMRLSYRDLFRAGEVVNMGDAKNPQEQITLGTSSDGLTWTISKRGTTPKVHPINREAFGRKYVSWTEARSGNELVYAWTNTGDNSHLAPDTTDLTYPSYQRAALAQAIHSGLDVPGLHEAYDWLDHEMRGLVTSKKLPVGDNWCVMPAPTKRRPPRRRTDATDLQLHIGLRELIDELRGEDT